MTTTTTPSAITPQLKVTMLKHLVAGKDLDFVATVTRVPRDDVLDIVSAHGYPDVDKMAWAVDILTKTVGKIPERPTATHRGAAPLDRPTPAHAQSTGQPQRPNGYAITPPTPVRPVHTSAVELLHQASESPFIRTQNIGTKISALLADLTARLNDEQAAAEAKAQADRESARIATRIATLQAEIDKLKRKPAKPDKPAPTATEPRSERLTRGVHPCTTEGCDRTFDTGQGAAAHRRRAHEGWNPSAKAAS